MRVANTPETRYPKWAAWQLAVLAIGFTDVDQRQPGSKVLRPTAAGETAAPVPTGSPPRNVHMIVLESFWDAALLTGSGLSMDPLDPRFRELWRQAGNSHVLSPIFGGYTANAEFESLCGFPVTENHVFFESGLRNQAPCLPQILEEAGYRSIASHPNVAGFWNRVNAYRRIGFRTYWSDRDFVLDDLNGEFLSDSSLYRQTMAKIGSRADRERRHPGRGWSDCR